MKNKTLIILILVFAFLMAGAYGLYNFLSADMERDALVIREETTQAEITTAQADPEPPVENTPAPSKAPDSPKEDIPLAPDFTVYDIDGREVHLSDFVGKPVVLNFWATWCTYCKMHLPVFEDAYQTYGEDIHFLMINLTDGSRETVESASSYIEENSYTFPIYYDTSYSAAIAYGTSSIPVTYFIDAEGHGIAYGSGALTADAIQMGIDMIYTP